LKIQSAGPQECVSVPYPPLGGAYETAEYDRSRYPPIVFCLKFIQNLPNLSARPLVCVRPLSPLGTD